MARKCYTSFKMEDVDYKNAICNDLKVDMIDKSLHEEIDSDDEEYIMQQIRENYLSDSTVTIHLLGAYGAENRGSYEQRFIKRELQASLYNGQNNSRSGILGIVLPIMYPHIYTGQRSCNCGSAIRTIAVNDTTTIKEFSYNYHIPNNKCHWSEEDRYCVMTTWDDFILDPNKYIEQAFEKRFAPIASKIKVYP